MADSYHALTEAEAVDYVRSLPDLFAPGAELACREIGDGNLNLVFHIRDKRSGTGIIMKQALPYAKVVGESWPLSLDRARIESEALIQEAKLCPDLVPKVYKRDEALALTVMEDLSDHVIMRRGLIEGNRYPRFADDISTFLARTLFFTSDLGMNQQDKKRLAGRFINPDLCKITEDLIFDHPYTDAETNSFEEHLRDAVEAVWADGELHREVAILREGFLSHAQALLHGDLHTGSIFVTADSTKVIDPEFAFFGPMGFDIGAVIANLLLNYAAQEGWQPEAGERAARRRERLDMIRGVWAGFADKFAALWDEHGIDRMAAVPGYKSWYMQRLLRDAIGYAGCKTVRRVIGLAHVADIDQIADPAARERAQRMALAIGVSLIKAHRGAASIDDLLNVAAAQAQA